MNKKFQVIGSIFMFEGVFGIIVAGLTGSVFTLPGLFYGLCKFGFGIYIALCDEGEEASG